ncbi:hypothetical protein KFE25_000467 [Diacronema lutheri]|uniref:Uncharacterized protein n=1 Tax=Diacronema lutheri TaxID=2081491 RepID=A0A8J6CDJ5_DIALT|nr:hypothetical protein KFE25_000467 [Diacronema lutheri]
MWPARSATSVDSKALTIRQAMCIAAVIEFAGALLLGASVSDTIRSSVADVTCFVDMLAVLMWGMCTVCLCTGSVWLFIATYPELPVSTTHSVIGSLHRPIARRGRLGLRRMERAVV